jgi:predicted nucleotide-binding protein
MTSAIPKKLLERLQKKLQVTPRHVHRLIAQRANDAFVSNRAGAMLLARDLRLNWQQFATSDDRNEMRGVPQAVAPALPAKPQSNSATLGTKNGRLKPIRTTKNNTIFLVHGRDKTLNEDMFNFLRALGLNAEEFSQAINATTGANPNITKVVKGALKRAQGVLVMFSPDEEARLKRKFRTTRDSPSLQGQSRLNVIFEAGIALGAHPEKTLLIEVGDVRSISDIAGMHIPRLTNDSTSRKELAQRLKTKLKMKVDTSGDYWLTVGNFSR